MKTKEKPALAFASATALLGMFAETTPTATTTVADEC
jgi:hypothetical protein